MKNNIMKKYDDRKHLLSEGVTLNGFNKIELFLEIEDSDKSKFKTYVNSINMNYYMLPKKNVIYNKLEYIINNLKSNGANPKEIYVEGKYLRLVFESNKIYGIKLDYLVYEKLKDGINNYFRKMNLTNGEIYTKIRFISTDSYEVIHCDISNINFSDFNNSGEEIEIIDLIDEIDEDELEKISMEFYKIKYKIRAEKRKEEILILLGIIKILENVEEWKGSYKEFKGEVEKYSINIRGLSDEELFKKIISSMESILMYRGIKVTIQKEKELFIHIQKRIEVDFFKYYFADRYLSYLSSFEYEKIEDEFLY